MGPRLGAADANVAQAFHVSTTTELAPSDPAGGFNSDIDPEKTPGFELGVKGLLWQRVFYDLVLFDLRLDQVTVPFDEGGPLIFRDAGEVRRRGVELAFSALLRPGLDLRASYTYADYRYADFDVTSSPVVTEFDGRREPNTPRHSVGAELRAEHPGGLYAALSLRHFSDIEIDDANTAESRGAPLSDLRVGWDVQRERAASSPYPKTPGSPSAVAERAWATFDAAIRSSWQ